MPNTIQCDIVSAQERLFSGEVTRCVVSGSEGELGIHPRHAPLMATLKAGEVRVAPADGEEQVFVIGGGILEVMPHLVTVLADSAIRADDIDEAAAKQARAEAERELATRTTDMELLHAEIKLAEALARLRAVEHLRSRHRLKQK